MDHAALQKKKERTARLSVFSNSILVTLKVMVGVSLGSVAILSEAIHSGMDLIAAGIAYISVKTSGKPPDDEHAFGHGKFEDFSGLFEAMLIFAAAFVIIFESVHQILLPEPEVPDPLLMYAGIGVMGVPAIINAFVSNRLMHVAKETESIALESDAWHLKTDVYTSLGVFFGLIIIQITGILIIDSFIAIAVGLVIMRAAFDLSRRSYYHLSDHRLTDEEEDRIKEIMCDHRSDFVNFHNLRTRRAGPEVFIEFHLVLDRTQSIKEAHDLTDHLESDLKTAFPRSTITIHIEPDTPQHSRHPDFCKID